jgi:signal transduction histidine kinase
MERLQESVEAAHRLVRARLQVLSTETPASLRGAIEGAARRSRATVRVTGHGDAGPEAITFASRVVSEALANADAHAHAHAVEVSYAASDERLDLAITDDGDGFDPSTAAGVEDGHLGLTVMRERARGYGGECEVTSAPGQGTQVRLWIPL